MLENIKIMDMKRVLFIVAAAAMTLTSCVSLSEMEALQAKYDQTSKKYNLTQQELLEMKEENAELSRVNQSLSSEMTDMALAKASAEARADSLNRRLEQMHHHYDTTMENYVQDIAGKSRDLTRAQNLLTARTKELNDKERELSAKEMQLAEQQEDFMLQRSELIAKQKELESKEAAARAQLAAKQRELDAVRNSVTKALTGFADKGLSVETKDGKVYIENYEGGLRVSYSHLENGRLQMDISFVEEEDFENGTVTAWLNGEKKDSATAFAVLEGFEAAGQKEEIDFFDYEKTGVLARMISDTNMARYRLETLCGRAE